MNIIKFLTPKSDTVFLEDTMSLRQAMEKMEYHKYAVVPVLDKDGAYVSCVSDGDILRFIKNDCNFNIRKAEKTSIAEIEKAHPYVALGITCKTKDVIELALSQNFIPIVDDRNIFVGFIKRKDVIEYFNARFNAIKKDVQNL